MSVSADSSPNWQQATTLDELVAGPVVFKSGRRQLAVFRVETAEGPTVYAVDNRCPHEGYPLAEGTVDESCQLTCNWHNWKFRLDDGKCVLGGDNLGRYDVRVEADGGVLVDLSEATPAVANGGSGFKSTYLFCYWSDFDKIADLSFSAKVHFFSRFLFSKNE